jgi:hypothetical protein
MRIEHRDIVIVPHGAAREVLIITGGYQIALGADEARRIATELQAALVALGPPAVGDAAAPAPAAAPPAEACAEGEALLDSLRRLAGPPRDAAFAPVVRITAGTAA